MKLIMTLLVRDEEDILKAHMDFHLSRGVDKIIVMDNMSVDATRDIVIDYVKTGAAHYIYQGRDDYAQGQWVTGMARMAYDQFGADWVINSDADEFWWTDAPSLKDVLTAEPPSVSAVRVARNNFVPRPESRELFWQRMDIRETRSVNALGDPLSPKVIHRGHPDVRVDQGNHRVFDGEEVVPTLPCGISILHFPVRSETQFINKIAKGGAAYARNADLPPQIGSAWRHLYDLYLDGRLADTYRQGVLSDAEIAGGLQNGELIRDERLKAVLDELRRR